MVWLTEAPSLFSVVAFDYILRSSETILSRISSQSLKLCSMLLRRTLRYGIASSVAIKIRDAIMSQPTPIEQLAATRSAYKTSSEELGKCWLPPNCLGLIRKER